MESGSEAAPIDPLRADVAALSAAPPTDHAAAAAAWLGLFDRWLATGPDDEHLQRTRDQDSVALAHGPLPFDDIIAALPGPDAWPALAAAVAARPAATGLPGAGQRALGLLCAWLMQDDAAFDAAAREAVERVKTNGAHGGYMAMSLASSLAALAGGDPGEMSPEKLRENVEQQIAAVGQENPVHSFDLPDLATHLDEASARALLLQVLVLPINYLQIDVGDETKNLARSVATEHAAMLGQPRWDLVDTIGADSVALYEALAAAEAASQNEKAQGGDAGKAQGDASGKGFLEQLVGLVVGSDDPYGSYGGSYGDRARAQARVHYLLGLIVQRRTDDAVALVEKHFTGDQGEDLNLPYGVTQTLAASGAWEPLFEFAGRMLDRPDGVGFWSVYIEAAAQIGRSDAALVRAEAVLAQGQGDLNLERRARLLGLVADARLAADHVEQGVAARLQQIDALGQVRSAAPREAARLYLQIATIGDLHANADWFNRGVDGVQAALAKNGKDDYSRGRTLDALSALLSGAGHGPRAEALLVDEFRRVRTQAADASSRGYSSTSPQDVLIDLVDLYASTERWEDVRVILEQAPGWEVDDLAEIYTRKIGKQTTLGGIAAQALHDAGRDAQSLEILTATLLQEAGQDSLYALLVDMRGDDATQVLDRLRVRDRFEERPLIWQAQVDLNAGRLDKAEEHVRAAIAIDPSDGEQGPGDRMRAYAVLGQILRARGDADSAATAQVMEGAVRAIRAAERADRFYAAGLLSQGVTLYKESLTHFADAYCIQSRLAVRLASMGRLTEAAVHYQKAYELMPDSFGRVESHCFGCEGVFRGETAQGVAEKVFGQLVLAYPLKPQVHYLRGYLASDGGKKADALPHYRRAVELDPDYLNAWSKIAGLGRGIQLSRADRDSATLNIFRLDPLGRHSSASFDAVGDMAGAWRAVAQAQSLRVDPPASLLALGAHAPDVAAAQGSQQDVYGGSFRRVQTLLTPGEMLVEHDITEVARQMLQAEINSF